MPKFSVLIIFLLCSFYAPSIASASPVSRVVGLDSWVYPTLDKLSGLGMVASELQGMRPLTALEIARQINDATLKCENKSCPIIIREILQRLKVEFSTEIIELQDVNIVHSYVKPYRTVNLSYSYQTGQPSRYPATNSSQYALNSNNSGIEFENGNNAVLRIAGDARIKDFLGLEWQPLLQASEGEGDFQWMQSRVALQLGPVEVSLGRQSLWWGQGRHGSLILTDNARPLDMLRFTNPTPGKLPWLFKYLGPIRFDMFWSRLENSRFVPEPYLAGLRVNFKPQPWLELGASRTITFGGQGRPSLDLGDYLTILDGTNLGANDTSNSVAEFDWRIRIPYFPVEIYGEFGGEDENDKVPTKAGAIFGLYLPGIDPAKRIGLRLEYADLNLESIGPTWYAHGVYRSGYTYYQKIMGHQVGGDSQDLFVALDWYADPALHLIASLDFEKRGDSRLIKEKHFQPGLQLRWQYAKRTDLRMDLYYDRIQNADFIADNNQESYLATLSISLGF